MRKCFVFKTFCCLILTSLAVTAQSPTETSLRILYRRLDNYQAPVVISSTSKKTTKASYVNSHRIIKSRVKAFASTINEARRKATRRAYSDAMHQASNTVGQFNDIASHLAETLSELKSIKSRTIRESLSPSGASVEVEIEQDSDALTRSLRSYCLSNMRVVALLPETIDGEPVTVRKIETGLIDALSLERFRVYDWNFVTHNNPISEITNAVLYNRTDPSVVIGKRFLANTLIVGRVQAALSQRNDGIVSYRAIANLRVIKVDTGQILVSHEYMSTGFGQDKSQASRVALEELQLKVSKELPEELLRRMESFPITIHVETRDSSHLQEVESTLRRIPGVMQVIRSNKGEQTSFRVISRDNATILGANIEQSGTFDVSTSQP